MKTWVWLLIIVFLLGATWCLVKHYFLWLEYKASTKPDKALDFSYLTVGLGLVVAAATIIYTALKN